MRPAQEALLTLIDRIFADGVVTQAERRELGSLVLIARELKLPKDCMPAIVAQIVAAA